MAVRRQLDLAGVKLELQHWSELSDGERAALLSWADDLAAIEALRGHRLERTDQPSRGSSCPCRSSRCRSSQPPTC